MTPLCRVCERTQIVKKGANRCGNTQHHGKDCGASGVRKPKPASWQTEHHSVLRVCRERRSLRGVTRLFAMARQTGARWLTTHVQNLPEVKASLLPAAPEEVLDLEEMWRGVRNKEQARWVWTAMCRLTETPHRRLGHWRPKPARPAFGSGKPLRMGPNPATPSVIGGTPLKTCSWLKLLPVVGRKLGRPRRWNGGTPPSANG